MEWVCRAEGFFCVYQVPDPVCIGDTKDFRLFASFSAFVYFVKCFYHQCGCQMSRERLTRNILGRGDCAVMGFGTVGAGPLQLLQRGETS